jgi:hypothetical protein
MVADDGLLAIDFRTLFVLAPGGRIERENDPDHSPGPRFWLAGCASGNVSGDRFDVSEGVAGIAVCRGRCCNRVRCSTAPIGPMFHRSGLSRVWGCVSWARVCGFRSNARPNVLTFKRTKAGWLHGLVR